MMNTKLFYVLFMVLWLLPHISSAAVASKTASTLTIDKSVHFLMADGSDGVVDPGVYLVEDADEWLRLISDQLQFWWSEPHQPRCIVIPAEAGI